MSDFDASAAGSGSGGPRPGPRPGARPGPQPGARPGHAANPAVPGTPGAPEPALDPALDPATETPAPPRVSPAPAVRDEDGLLGRIELIEAQPLPQRAAGFEQLHDELLADLQRGDTGGV